ncbi:DUF3343 domain-containing protein [Curtanaerobium respiraculi]|uniref:DUF3343 domain-containing protein n=1 Tax=Curtanaerobium respiraculi TaxID=2949669 RepID=UPI0024B3C086|nr:DUF3343 domain-containing protein [Curtanaerobium respiraculi]
MERCGAADNSAGAGRPPFGASSAGRRAGGAPSLARAAEQAEEYRRANASGAGLEARIQAMRERVPGVPIDVYVMFDGHTDAMALHEAARAAGLHTRISAAPRAIKASCGVTVLVPAEEAEALESLAGERGLPYDSFNPLPRQIDPKRDRYC